MKYLRIQNIFAQDERPWDVVLTYSVEKTFYNIFGIRRSSVLSGRNQPKRKEIISNLGPIIFCHILSQNAKHKMEYTAWLQMCSLQMENFKSHKKWVWCIFMFRLFSRLLEADLD